MRLSRHEIQEFLAEESLFRGSPPATIERLCELGLQSAIPRERTFFSMGQPCEELHSVVRGTGLLVKVSTEGRKHVLHRAGPGDIVGCVPFFDGKGYPATFVAETDCVMLSLPRKELLKLFGEEPRLALSIIGALVMRLREMAGIVEQVSFEDTTHRLWDFLVTNSSGPASSVGEEYPRVVEKLPTRARIADAIGTVREVVSRRLSRLAESGHIRLDGSTVTLLKPLR